MKRVKNIILVVCSMFFIACSVDKGNYDYIDLNDIIFEEINNGSPIARSTGDSIKIDPKFSRALDSSQESDLSYMWILGGDTISFERNLRAIVPNTLAVGSNPSRFIVKTSNGMVYSTEFVLDVSNGYGFGYYILCENEDESSTVYYLPSQVELDKGATEEFKSTSYIGEIKLGNKPSRIAGDIKWNSTLRGYFYDIFVATEEGSAPIIVTDNLSFEPSSVLNGSSFLDQVTRTMKVQDFQINSWNDQFIVNDGVVIAKIDHFLYIPENLGHYWEKVHVRISDAFVVDRETKIPYLIKSTDDDYTMDEVVEIQNLPADIASRDLLYVEMDSNSGTLYIFTKNGADIEMATISYGGSTYNPVAQLSHAEISSTTKVEAIWDLSLFYFVIGNKLYSSPKTAPVLGHFVDLPTDLGEVVEVVHAGLLDHMLITYYDEATKLGSLVRVWLDDTKKVDIFKHQFTRPVSLGSFDNDDL